MDRGNYIRYFSIFFTLLAGFVLAAVASAAEQVSQPFVGVTLREVVRDQPRPLRIWVAQIDPRAEGIRFRVSPGNGDPNGNAPGDPNGETTRQTTLQFLKQQQAQLAINASFFEMGEADTDNRGLVVSDGEHVSPFYKRTPSINLDPKNRVRIVRGKHDTYEVRRPKSGVTLHNAVAGSDQIVTKGKATTDERDFSTTLHPRTAIGFTAKRQLVLAVVDGRQPGISEGMSLAELAELMIEHGCIQALNLDGGGSTTMAIADPDPRTLNTPSSKDEAGNHGVLRSNGTSLAVFAHQK